MVGVNRRDWSGAYVPGLVQLHGFCRDPLLLARTLLNDAPGGTELWSLNLRKENFVMKKMLALLLGLMFAATTVTMIACGGATDDDDSAAGDDDDSADS